MSDARRTKCLLTWRERRAKATPAQNHTLPARGPRELSPLWSHRIHRLWRWPSPGWPPPGALILLMRKLGPGKWHTWRLAASCRQHLQMTTLQVCTPFIPRVMALLMLLRGAWSRNPQGKYLQMQDKNQITWTNSVYVTHKTMTKNWRHLLFSFNRSNTLPLIQKLHQKRMLGLLIVGFFHQWDELSWASHNSNILTYSGSN